MSNIDRVTKVNITSSVSPTTPTATFTPNSFANHDNNHFEENVFSPPRALDAKRPPPLELSISSPDTNATSPKVAQQTTPKSATSIFVAGKSPSGIPPKTGSNFRTEVSPSHPYYQAKQNVALNSYGARKYENPSPATMVPVGMQPNKKKFISPLNLGLLIHFSFISKHSSYFHTSS